MFLVGAAIILILTAFSDRILNSCCKMNKLNENREATSDDFYDQIHLRFLLNEYERAKEGIVHKCEKYL